ncbi:MAG: hypothetical protein NZ651_03960 [Candidatus Bipolaricaulota bacterium]|nr:hypothetical protein [Candidatus Bipolaricaulota bacterium]MDW8126908.1 hypothetical protein [Candidatus Bipolaricaulota bacterium]
MIFLLLLLTFSGASGEIGARVEGLAPAGTVWLETDWEEVGATARIEGNLFPLGFRRGNLKIAWGLGEFSLAPEFTVFGSGRIDLFLSSSLESRLTTYGSNLAFHAGAKGGLAAVNLAPSVVFATWLIIAVEKDAFSAELSLDGPYPWQSRLEICWDQVTLNLGTIISLTLSGEQKEWQLSSTFQIWPKPVQTHSLVWTGESSELRISLASSGQHWCRVGESQGDWAVSAFFAFSCAQLTQVALEVVRTF